MTAAEGLIADYGLFAVFIGGLLEGETLLILAAVAAHHGVLPLPSVFFVAATAATLGDQAWFLLARRRSDLKLLRNLLAKPQLQRAMGLIQRHPTAFVLSFRFIYGLRIAGAVACGFSTIPTTRFVFLNLIAALIWTGVMLALGYGFGSAVEAALGDIKRVEWKILAAAAVFAVVIVTGRWLARRWRG